MISYNNGESSTYLSWLLVVNNKLMHKVWDDIVSMWMKIPIIFEGMISFVV